MSGYSMPFCLDYSRPFRNMLGFMDVAIAIPQCLEVYHGGDGAKVEGNGGRIQKYKKTEKVQYCRFKGVVLGSNLGGLGC